MNMEVLVVPAVQRPLNQLKAWIRESINVKCFKVIAYLLCKTWHS